MCLCGSTLRSALPKKATIAIIRGLVVKILGGPRIATIEVGDLVLASVYVPNGGKDYPAKLRFLEALADWAGDVQASGRSLVVAGRFAT